MSKGIIYVLTSSVKSLIKIGKTETNNFNKRMQFLEQNGYSNVGGLKKYFAIEVTDYDEKEKLLHKIFSRHRVSKNNELFAIECETVKELLECFQGKVIYPSNKSENNGKSSELIKSKSNRFSCKTNRFSFYKKGIKEGEEIVFCDDKNIKAIVTSEKTVKFNGKEYKLSPLTKEIYKQKNKLNKSGAYQGANYFEYKGIKLTKIPDIN